MANTYLSLYIHFVFAVKYRDAKLIPVYRKRIYEYMKQTTRNLGHTPIAIGGTDNHIHILISYNPNYLIPDYVRELKTSATKFINNELLLSHRFEWQRGYGAFTHSYRDVEAVKHYILHQTEHHNNETFDEEIHRMFDRCGIVYSDEYMFGDV